MKKGLKRIACLAIAALVGGSVLSAAECSAADGAEIFTYMDFIDENGAPIGEGCEDVWGTYNSGGDKSFAAETGNTDFEENAVRFEVRKGDREGKLLFTAGQEVASIDKNNLKNAIVKMRIYAAARSEDNLPERVKLNFTGKSGSFSVSKAVPVSDITLKEWCDIDIPLEPAVEELDAELSLDSLEFLLPVQMTEKYSVYISKLQIIYEHRSYIETEISTDEDAIVISWDANFEAEQYKVFCNGEQIGETADMFFRYIPEEYGKIFKFTVEGYDGSGELLAASKERSMFLYSPDREIFYDILGEDGKYTSNIKPYSTPGQSPTGIVDEGVWWVYANGTVENGNSPSGGNSLRYVADKAKSQPGSTFQLRVGFTETMDFSDGGKDRYFEFLIYPESEFEDDFKWTVMFHGNNCALSKNLSGLIPGEWNYVRMPMSEFGGMDAVIKNGVERIQINFPKNLQASPMSFKIANMCITVPRKATTASIAGCGISDTGRTYTDVSFSRAMDTATVSAADFGIDGFNATELISLSDTDFRVYYDKAFEFPKEYVLEISEDRIRDKDGRKLSPAALSFKTRTFCPDVVVTDADVDKTDIESGIVRCKASLNAIFKGDRSAVSGKLLLAATQNDRVIATAESAPFEAAVGGSVRLSAELGSEELKNAADCNISLYFISDDGNERPLCAYENK